MGLLNDLARGFAEEFGAHAIIGRFPRFFGLQPGQPQPREPQGPRKVPDALFKVPPEKQLERAGWLEKLPDSKKLEMERFSPAALEKLFAQDDPAVRDQLLSGLLEKNFLQELRELGQKIESAAPDLPKTAARIHDLAAKYGHTAYKSRQQRPAASSWKLISDFLKDCNPFRPFP